MGEKDIDRGDIAETGAVFITFGSVGTYIGFREALNETTVGIGLGMVVMCMALIYTAFVLLHIGLSYITDLQERRRLALVPGLVAILTAVVSVSRFLDQKLALINFLALCGLCLFLLAVAGGLLWKASRPSVAD